MSRNLSFSHPYIPGATVEYPNVPEGVTVGKLQARFAKEELDKPFKEGRALPEAAAALPQFRESLSGTKRAAVASMPKVDAREGVLRQMYPKVVRIGADNFAFFDPEKKGWRIYNEPGLQGADVTSMAREMAEFTGGTAGAIGGTAAGNIPGGVVGAGLGATVAGEAATRGLLEAADVEDPRTRGQVATDLFKTGLAESAGQLGGEALSLGGRYALRGGKSLLGAPNAGDIQEAQRVVREYTGQDVLPMGGAAGRLSRVLQGATAQEPMAGQLYERGAQRFVSDLERAREALAPRGRGESQQPGMDLQAGIEQAGERFRGTIGTLEERLDASVAPDTQIDLSSTMDLYDRLNARLEADPTMEGAIRPIVGELERILTDPTGATFRGTRRFTTELRRRLDTPDISGYTPGQTELNQLYGALREDLGRTAESLGGAAQRNWSALNRYVAGQREANINMLDRAVDKAARAGDPSALYRQLA
ncbi:MAG: hypothetical protein ACYTFZ_07765 [Planctomycetota bacterium]|jgi:hypothetical protein